MSGKMFFQRFFRSEEQLLSGKLTAPYHLGNLRILHLVIAPHVDNGAMLRFQLPHCCKNSFPEFLVHNTCYYFLAVFMFLAVVHIRIGYLSVLLLFSMVKAYFVKGYFIVGLPGDSEDKVRQAVAYARREEIDMPRFALVQAFPHTELAEWVAQHGHFFYEPYDYVLHNTDEFHSDVHYELPTFPGKAIWKTYIWAHEQAEALSFKQALIRRFGRGWGNILILFNNKLIRLVAIWLYQKKIISLPK